MSPTRRWRRRVVVGVVLQCASIAWVLVASAVIAAHERDGFARAMNEFAVAVGVAPIFLVGLILMVAGLLGWMTTAHRARLAAAAPLVDWEPTPDAGASGPTSDDEEPKACTHVTASGGVPSHAEQRHLPPKAHISGNTQRPTASGSGLRARAGPAAAALAVSGFEMLWLALLVNSMSLAIVASVVAVVGGVAGVVGVASRSNRLGSRLLGLTGIVVAIFSAGLVVNEVHSRETARREVPTAYQAAEASRRSEDCALLQRGQVPVGQIVMMPSVFPASAVSCQLRGVNLSGAALAEAGLWNTDLSGANLSGANLRHARFDNANLTGANLQGADLTDAILLDAKLVNVDLTGADLTGAMVNDADFTGATWAHTTCPSGTNSDLRGHVIEEPASRLGVALVGGTCVGEGHLGTRPR